MPFFGGPPRPLRDGATRFAEADRCRQEAPLPIVARWHSGGVRRRKRPCLPDLRRVGSVPGVCHPGTRNGTATRPVPGAWISARGSRCQSLSERTPAAQDQGKMPAGATGCHMVPGKGSKGSRRCQAGVTPLSLIQLGESDERCQRGQEGVKGVTGCHRGSKPLPLSWHLSVRRFPGRSYLGNFPRWRRASSALPRMRAGICGLSADARRHLRQCRRACSPPCGAGCQSPFDWRYWNPAPQRKRLGLAVSLKAVRQRRRSPCLGNTRSLGKTPQAPVPAAAVVPKVPREGEWF